jgi:hypothetical protein
MGEPDNKTPVIRYGSVLNEVTPYGKAMTEKKIEAGGQPLAGLSSMSVVRCAAVR